MTLDEEVEFCNKMSGKICQEIDEFFQKYPNLDSRLILLFELERVLGVQIESPNL